jgi:hypothetical protein
MRPAQTGSSLLAALLAMSVAMAPAIGLQRQPGMDCQTGCLMAATRCATEKAKPQSARSCCARHAPAQSKESGDRESAPPHKPGHCSCCVTLGAGSVVLAPVQQAGYGLVDPLTDKVLLTGDTSLMPGWCEPLRRPPRA